MMSRKARRDQQTTMKLARVDDALPRWHIELLPCNLDKTTMARAFSREGMRDASRWGQRTGKQRSSGGSRWRTCEAWTFRMLDSARIRHDERRRATPRTMLRSPEQARLDGRRSAPAASADEQTRIPRRRAAPGAGSRGLERDERPGRPSVLPGDGRQRIQAAGETNPVVGKPSRPSPWQIGQVSSTSSCHFPAPRHNEQLPPKRRATLPHSGHEMLTVLSMTPIPRQRLQRRCDRLPSKTLGMAGGPPISLSVETLQIPQSNLRVERICTFHRPTVRFLGHPVPVVVETIDGCGSWTDLRENPASTPIVVLRSG